MNQLTIFEMETQKIYGQNYNTMKIFPDKLNKGDEVRVIAPSLSLKNVSQANIGDVCRINATESLVKIELIKH